MSNALFTTTTKRPRSSVKAIKAPRKPIWRRMKPYGWCYVMFLPVFAYLVIFRYWPLISQFMLSMVDYSFAKGIFGSDFIGLTNFQRMIESRAFYNVFMNTLIIAALRIFFSFFPPILLAIFINDVSSRIFRKVTQTIVYIPHFLSWIIVYGIAYAFLSPGIGIINGWLKDMGKETVAFFTDVNWFRPIVILTFLWKTSGWGTIIYLASLSGISVELYEAANIDGANVWQRLMHITLPGMKPVIVFVLTLNMGSILASGFEQILLFQTTATYAVSDTLETWTYRRGLINMEFSFAATVGLMQSLIGFFMVYVTNKLARKYADSGIY